MTTDRKTDHPPILAGVAVRYPDKTFYLGQVFQDTTNSYKLVWFLAILSLLRKTNESVLCLADIFTEMAIIAWHPVCLYRLSLGRQDKLQEAVIQMKTVTELSAHASPEDIRRVVNASMELRGRLEFLRAYVPTRFLAPWFADKLRGEPDYHRSPRIETMAKESQRTAFACPYYLVRCEGSDSIRLNESWRSFLTENFAVVLAFGEYHFALFLQARNPNVPGIVNKLRAPVARQLRAARDFWRSVRRDVIQAGKEDSFTDIYSQNLLGEDFSIDHFLPWTFVVHDLLWNLVPVEVSTNSKKGDVLPDLDQYLPRLAKLHLTAIGASLKRPKSLEDYTDCFKQEPETLLTLGENGLLEKYREVIVPQTRIAMNQGFQSGWIFRS